MSLLSQVFSTITSSLPTLKISKWDIQVQRKPQRVEESDSFLGGIINMAKNAIRLVQDTVSGFFQQTGELYTTIADFDSFISFQGSHDSQIVKNVIENGSFRSVNKIKSPDQVVIELAKGGYRSGIEEVLSKLRKYEGSTYLCRIITPFGILENLNIIKLEYSYTRDNGSNLLIAKITLQEIVGGSVKPAGYTLGMVNTPDKADTQNTGNKALGAR